MMNKTKRNYIKVNLRDNEAVTVTLRSNIRRSIVDCNRSEEISTASDPINYTQHNLYGLMQYRYSGNVYGHFISRGYCVHPYELNKHEIYDARLDI